MATLNDTESNRIPSEKEMRPPKAQAEKPDMEVTEGKQARAGGWRGIMSVLEKRGDVEFRGCTPVPYEDRTETNYFNIFTLWFCMSCNPLPYVPPVSYQIN